MKRLGIAALLLCSVSAFAQDTWTGRDKQLHAIGGAGIGAVGTMVFKDARYGCAAATAVGALKEVLDSQNRDKHTPSYKDFVVTAAAGCISAYSTQWLFVVPTKDGAIIQFRKRF